MDFPQSDELWNVNKKKKEKTKKGYYITVESVEDLLHKNDKKAPSSRRLHEVVKNKTKTSVSDGRGDGGTRGVLSDYYGSVPCDPFIREWRNWGETTQPMMEIRDERYSESEKKYVLKMYFSTQNSLSPSKFLPRQRIYLKSNNDRSLTRLMPLGVYYFDVILFFGKKRKFLRSRRTR